MNKQLLIIIVLVAAVGGTGYWWFTSVLPSGEETSSVIDEALESRLVSYRRLQDVKLDMSAFQDDFFKQLVQIPDLLTPLIPPGQNLGRPNPYSASVGGVSSVPASGSVPKINLGQ